MAVMKLPSLSYSIRVMSESSGLFFGPLNQRATSIMVEYAAQQADRNQYRVSRKSPPGMSNLEMPPPSRSISQPNRTPSDLSLNLSLSAPPWLRMLSSTS